MHPLFDELQAFNPRWQQDYCTLRAAATAAGVYALYVDWCRGRGEHTAGCQPCRAMVAAARALKAQADSDSLPYHLDTIGQALDSTAEEYNTDLAELL